MAGAEERLDVFATKVNMTHTGTDGDAKFFTHQWAFLLAPHLMNAAIVVTGHIEGAELKFWKQYTQFLEKLTGTGTPSGTFRSPAAAFCRPVNWVVRKIIQ